MGSRRDGGLLSTSLLLPGAALFPREGTCRSKPLRALGAASSPGRVPAYLLVEFQDLRVGLGAPVAGRGGVFPEDAAGDVAEAGRVRRALGAGGRGPLGDLTAERGPTG